MKMKAIYGDHSISIAIVWFIVTISAIGYILYRQIAYHLDIFDLMDMNLHIFGLAFVGISYLLEDMWVMSKNIHSSKYTKEGSKSYYFFSRICGVIAFIFLAFYFVHRYIVK
jgi:hypothetical protein